MNTLTLQDFMSSGSARLASSGSPHEALHPRNGASVTIHVVEESFLLSKKAPNLTL